MYAAGRDDEGGNAGTATNTGCCRKRTVGIIFLNGSCIGINSITSVYRNVSTSLDDPVKGTAVNHQILDNRE
jgi:hypothetical protein